jgi:hypothetical protein
MRIVCEACGRRPVQTVTKSQALAAGWAQEPSYERDPLVPDLVWFCPQHKPKS